MAGDRTFLRLRSTIPVVLTEHRGALTPRVSTRTPGSADALGVRTRRLNSSDLLLLREYRLTVALGVAHKNGTIPAVDLPPYAGRRCTPGSGPDTAPVAWGGEPATEATEVPAATLRARLLA